MVIILFNILLVSLYILPFITGCGDNETRIDDNSTNCTISALNNTAVRIEATDTFDAFGIIVKSKEGNLLNFYREGLTHANDFGQVVMRKSIDDGITWTTSQILFDDNVTDHRDIKGGVLSSGTIVLFWRQVDFVTLESPVYYSRSLDEGKTWSEVQIIPDSDVVYGGLISLPDSVAIAVGKISGPEPEGYIEMYLYKSVDDAENWAQGKRIYNPETYEYIPTEEVSIVYLGENRLFGIARDIASTNLLRFYSNDLGDTWDIKETNIGPSVSDAPLWWLISPWLTKVSERKLDLWYGERMYEMKDGRIQQVGGRLYSVLFDIEQGIFDPLNFETPRTLFSIETYVDMGYPSVAFISEDHYIGQFYSNTEEGLPDLFTINGSYVKECK